MVLILIGAGLTALVALVYAADRSGTGNLPVLLIALMLIIPVFGYSVLTLFLLANGVTMVRCESRSLGDLLSLLAGLVLVLWPLLFLLLERTSIPESLVFLFSALVYRLIRQPQPVSHVIVRGSGLVGERLPPLLAARLDRASSLLTHSSYSRSSSPPVAGALTRTWRRAYPWHAIWRNGVSRDNGCSWIARR